VVGAPGCVGGVAPGAVAVGGKGRPPGRVPAPAGGTGGSTSSSSPAPARAAEEPSGTLATDEALAALREKLAGGK